MGGAGFVGCNLASHYLAKGNKVTVFDNFSRKGTRLNLEWLRSLNPSGLKVVEGDIRTDLDKLSSQMECVDAVFHLTAQVAVTTSIENPREDFEINALGTLNVLEAIRLSRRKPVLIFASTNKVYGGMEDVGIIENNGRYQFKDYRCGIPESMTLDFHSPYGCSKGAADQYVRDYSRIYGLRTVVFRQSCIYGPHQFGVEDQGWVAHFTISAVLGRPITIYGDGKQVRDILYVNDLCRAFELATNNVGRISGQIYNIGGGPNNQVSLLEVIAVLEELMQHKVEYSFDNWRPGDQEVFVCDITRAKKDFGWEPRIDVRAGIRRLYDWVRESKGLLSAFGKQFNR